MSQPERQPWTSADCKARRHGSCIMAASCACSCHHSRLEKLRDLRCRYVEQIRQIDETIAELEQPYIRLAAQPNHRVYDIHTDSGCAAAILAVFTPGATLRSREVVLAVDTAHPGAYALSTIGQTIIILARQRVLERVERGVYRLPA